MTERPADVLPCPFCGAGEFREDASTHWTGMRSVVVSVALRHWCPKVEGCVNAFIEFRGRDREAAVRQWNQRAVDLALVQKMSDELVAPLVAKALGGDLRPATALDCAIEHARVHGCPVTDSLLERTWKAGAPEREARHAEAVAALGRDPSKKPYECPVCGVADATAYLRCNRPDCTDGRDPR